jgi:hypothetical protein
MIGATHPRANPHRKNTSIRLNARLDKKLLAYAVAASAAALTQSAEAKIVYTPANIPISTARYFSLDLNNDGIRDFIFTVGIGHGQDLGVQPTLLQPQNAIWGNASARFASALSSGVSVGPGAPFHAGSLRMEEIIFSSGQYSSFGPWLGAQNKYLGFSFVIRGKVHYGWARLNVSARNIFTATAVTGYAYETTPNTPIVTGQTKSVDGAGPQAFAPDVLSPPVRQSPSLGLLACGASGLAAWRKNDEETEKQPAPR